MSTEDTAITPPNVGDDADVRFEVLIQRLEEVVQRLESGDQSLEAALGDFETGMDLASRATTILDAAEERVEKLLVDRDGELTEAPLYGAQ